jgi:hypothetical protein
MCMCAYSVEVSYIIIFLVIHSDMYYGRPICSCRGSLAQFMMYTVVSYVMSIIAFTHAYAHTQKTAVK